MPRRVSPNRFPRGGPSKTRKGGRYDGNHARARKAAAAKHQPDDPCTRCHKPLGPMGPWLHYDHTDNGVGYLGFAHAACNRRAGAIAGNRAQQHTRRTRHAATPQPWQSRNW